MALWGVCLPVPMTTWLMGRDDWDSYPWRERVNTVDGSDNVGQQHLLPVATSLYYSATLLSLCDRFGGWSAGVRPVISGFSCTVHLLVVGGPRREERCLMGRDWRGKQASRRPESTSSAATVQKWFTVPSSQGYIFLNTQCLCLAPVVKYAVIALEAWDSMYTQVCEHLLIWRCTVLLLFKSIFLDRHNPPERTDTINQRLVS